MRRLLVAVLVLGACGNPRGYVDVHAHSDVPVVAVARFDVVMTIGGAAGSGRLVEDPAVDLPVDFALTPDHVRSGAVHVDVTAFDAANVALAHGVADGKIEGGAVNQIDLPMTALVVPMGDAGQDFAVPDLAVGDGAARDLTMVSTDLATTSTDLATAPADLAICGTVGKACCNGTTCNDGTRCLAGATSTRCAAFAGAFEASVTTMCGGTACFSDPYGGACACPAPFTATQTSSVDEGCGTASAPSNSTAPLGLCGITSLPTGSDWGGAFVSPDPFMSCLAAGSASANPITGAFSCPAGAEQVNLRIFVPTSNFDGTTCPNGFIGGSLSVCLMTANPVTTVAGVYETFNSDGACLTASTSAAGCACPADTSKLQIQTVMNSLARPSPQLGTITFCLANLP